MIVSSIEPPPAAGAAGAGFLRASGLVTGVGWDSGGAAAAAGGGAGVTTGAGFSAATGGLVAGAGEG
jgi:hypothetical protein